MAEKNTGKTKNGKSKEMQIRFKCQLCEQQKLLSDMRTVARFIPALIVCKDCAKIIR